MDDVIQLSLAVRGDMLYVDCTLPESETSIALHEDVVMDQLDSDCVRVGEDCTWDGMLGIYTVYTFGRRRAHHLRYHKTIGYAPEGLYGVREGKIILNIYANCFPLGLSEAVRSSRCVLEEGFEDYDLLDGVRDEQGRWVKEQNYRPALPECANLIALRRGRYHCVSRGEVSAYCMREATVPQLAGAVDYAQDCLAFYSQRFGSRTARHMTLFLLDEGEPWGGYCRDGLIVMGGVQERQEWYLDILGHELGHLWACGADTANFEDWLNETGAEWLSLLMLLHTGREDLFRAKIQQTLEQYKKSHGPILPTDGSRPGATHICGTVLFWMVYRDHGQDMVVALLGKLFALDRATTQNWLDAVAADPQTAPLAGWLEEAIRAEELL